MRSQPSLGSRQSCQAVYRQALLLNAARHPNKPTASPVKARNAVVAPARSGAASLTDAEQKRQRVALEDIADGFEVDSLVTVSFADDLRGLAAAEPVRSAALLTVPLRSTLGVQVEEDGTLTILSPLELPPNVKKAFEGGVPVTGGWRWTPHPHRLYCVVHGTRSTASPPHDSHCLAGPTTDCLCGECISACSDRVGASARAATRVLLPSALQPDHTPRVPRPPRNPRSRTVAPAAAPAAVASLIRHTPGHQHVILAALLLWARKYGNDTWQRYCSELLPPEQELSCLLCYTPAELPLLQLPHLVVSWVYYRPYWEM